MPTYRTGVPGYIIRDLITRTSNEIYLNGRTHVVPNIDCVHPSISDGIIIPTYIPGIDCAGDPDALVNRTMGVIQNISYAFKIGFSNASDYYSNFVPTKIRFRVAYNVVTALVYNFDTGEYEVAFLNPVIWALSTIKPIGSTLFDVSITGVAGDYTIEATPLTTDPEKRTSEVTPNTAASVVNKMWGFPTEYEVSFTNQNYNDLIDAQNFSACLDYYIVPDLEFSIIGIEFDGYDFSTDSAYNGLLHTKTITVTPPNPDYFNNNEISSSGYVDSITDLWRFERIHKGSITCTFTQQPSEFVAEGAFGYVYPYENNRDAPEIWGYHRNSSVTDPPVLFASLNPISTAVTTPQQLSGNIVFLQRGAWDTLKYVNTGSFNQLGDTFSGLTLKIYGLPSGSITDFSINLTGEGGTVLPATQSNRVQLHTHGVSNTILSGVVNLVQNPGFESGTTDLYLLNDPIETSPLPLYTGSNAYPVYYQRSLYNTTEKTSYYAGVSDLYKTTNNSRNHLVTSNSIAFNNLTHSPVPITYTDYDSSYSGVARKYQNSLFVGSNESNYITYNDNLSATHKLVYLHFSWLELNQTIFKNRVFERGDIQIELDNVDGKRSAIFRHAHNPLIIHTVDFPGTLEVLFRCYNIDDPYCDVDIYVGNAIYPMVFLGTFYNVLNSTSSVFGTTTLGSTTAATDVLSQGDRPLILHNYLVLDSSIYTVGDVTGFRNNNPANLITHLSTNELLSETIQNPISLNSSGFPLYKPERLVPFLVEPFTDNFEFYGSNLNLNALSVSFDCSGSAYNNHGYVISGYYAVGSGYQIGSGMTSGSISSGWDILPKQFLAEFYHSGIMDSFRRIAINPYRMSGYIADNNNSGVLKLGIYPLSGIDQSFYLNNFSVNISGYSIPTLESGSINLHSFYGNPEASGLNLFTFNNDKYSGNLNLHLFSSEVSFDSINLVTNGAQDFNDGVINLYTSGFYRDYGFVDLYTSGYPRNDSSLDLITSGDTKDYGSINLFTSGFYKTSDSVNLATINTPTSTNSSINLYQLGFNSGTESDSINLFLGSDTNVGAIDLFMRGNDFTSGSIDLMTRANSFEAKALDLFLSNTQLTSQQNLYMYGKDSTNSGVDLLSFGGLPNEKSINLLIHGGRVLAGRMNLHTTNNAYTTSSGFDLYIDAENNYNFSGGYGKNLNLFTTSLDNAGSINLYMADPVSGSDSGYMNLIAFGNYVPHTGIIDLFINNQSSGASRFVRFVTNGAYSDSGTMNLFIARDNQGEYNTLNMSLGTDNYFTKIIDFYQSGIGNSFNSLDMYTSGMGYQNSQVNLFNHGV